MEFVPRVEISIFYPKQKQAITEHILCRYNYIELTSCLSHSHDKVVLRVD